MSLITQACLIPELASKANGPDAIAGTLLLGKDGLWHAFPTVSSGGGGGGAAAVPIQDEGSTVQAAPTSINFVGSGVTATTLGTNVTVTIPGAGAGATDPYASLSEAQAGTAVDRVVNPADLFARESLVEQVGLSNNLALIAPPTAGQSRWGVNLLGEGLYYTSSGWKIVYNLVGFTQTAYVPLAPNTANVVTIIAPRTGRMSVSAYISALLDGGPVGKYVTAQINKGIVRFASTSEANNNDARDANASGTFSVNAGDVITINFGNNNGGGIASTLYSWQYNS
jgi:hypothetical protein